MASFAQGTNQASEAAWLSKSVKYTLPTQTAAPSNRGSWKMGDPRASHLVKIVLPALSRVAGLAVAG